LEASLKKNIDFNLSVVYPQAFPLSLEKNLPQELARLSNCASLNSIEITTVSDLSIRRDAAAVLDNSFEEVIFLAGLPSSKNKAFLNSSGTERARAVNYTKTLIEEAGELGASAFLVISGPDVKSTDRQESMQNLKNSLLELLIFASANFPEIQIRLEHTDREIHRRQLIGPTTDSLSLISEINDAGHDLKLNLDLSHILQLGEDVDSTLELAKAHCSHFHFSNCVIGEKMHPLYGDFHVPFGYPGSEVKFEQLIQTFQDLYRFGYLDDPIKTTLGIEVVPLIRDDPWTTLEVAIEIFNQAKEEAF
jgi:sugar phosphate isomerase/epimerase